MRATVQLTHIGLIKMDNLQLKPTADGSSVRLTPYNYCVFIKHNNRWLVDMDAGVPADVASIIFNAFHGLRCSAFVDAERLAEYINLFLTGKRLVIRSGVTISTNMMQPLTTLQTSRVIPVLHAGKLNTLGIQSLLDSLGLLGGGDVLHSCQYQAAGGKHGQVLVYVNELLKYRINCEVE